MRKLTKAEAMFYRMAGHAKIEITKAEISIALDSYKSSRVRNASFDLMVFVTGKQFRKAMYKTLAAMHQNFILSRGYFEVTLCSKDTWSSDRIVTYQIFFRGGCRLDRNWVVKK